MRVHITSEPGYQSSHFVPVASKGQRKFDDLAKRARTLPLRNITALTLRIQAWYKMESILKKDFT